MSATAADPVAQQLVANALSALADEMALIIFRTAHSTTVRDSMDFSASLCDAAGAQIAQAVTVPFHLGAVPVAMASLLARFGDSLAPGDVYIMNDPFDGGMHTPDIFVFRPVFLESELLGFACTTAHHADVGGRIPGSAATDNTEIYQEGLRLPWVRLYEAGKVVDDVVRIIRANVRIPEMTMGDVNAQVAACSVGASGLVELARRYGPEELAHLTTSLLDYTERLVREEIREWPDGTATFTDFLDSDGIETRPVPITVRLTIEDDEVTADFSSTAPMVRGALNCTHSVTAASVYLAIRAALRMAVPTTAGAFRPIHVVTKPGTVTHVVMPGASSMRGVTGFRIVDVVNGALAQLMPERIPAAGEGGNTLVILGGETAEHESFILYELVCGTWGGSSSGDGNDGLSNPASTAANVPVEIAEAEFPVVIENYCLLPDTGGAGKWRGGLAIQRSWRLLAAEASLVVRSDRQIHRPYGLSGGGDGGGSRNVIARKGGPEEALPPMFATRIYQGERFVHSTAGGGGWGDPLQRDPGAVAGDVAEGKVSRAAARAAYGVVLLPDGGVELAATEELRRLAAAARASDHGAEAAVAALVTTQRNGNVEREATPEGSDGERT